MLDGARVLIVEDEAIIALLLQTEMEQAGARVVGPCYSVPEALAALENGGIDAAILDVLVQDREVYPVAERLLQAGIPFLFHSGHALPEEIGDRFGSVPLLMKPASAEDLVEKVSDLLAD